MKKYFFSVCILICILCTSCSAKKDAVEQPDIDISIEVDNVSNNVVTTSENTIEEDVIEENTIILPRYNQYVNSMKSIGTDFVEVQFGSYEQDGVIDNGTETIDWYVLDEDGDKIMLISKYALDYKKFNDTDEAITWETSDLRKWLNDDFYNEAFDKDEQQFIYETKVGNPDNHWTGIEGGNDTIDKVYILSFEEVCKYFTICWQYGGYDDEWMTIMSQDAICTPTDYVVNNYEDAEGHLFENVAFTNGSYYDYGYTKDALGVEDINLWIRTNGDKSNHMIYSQSYGFEVCGTVGTGVISEMGIRPVIWVDKSVVYGG